MGDGRENEAVESAHPPPQKVAADGRVSFFSLYGKVVFSVEKLTRTSRKL